jgi:hypothetical protein
MKPLTPYEREIVADIFKKAKAIFEEGGCDYICTALYCTLPHIYSEYSEEYRVYKLAKAIVMERLEGRNSLESWLKKQGFFSPINPSPELEQKLRNHRLQWLDLLIAEFEGEKS